MLDRITDRMANSLLPRISESLLILALSGPLAAADQAMPVWDLGGTPEAVGAREGVLAAGSLPRLLRTMGGGAWLLQWWRRPAVDAWIAAIPEAHRRELDAVADLAGIDRRRVLRTNVLVESCCSVLVVPAAPGRPLRIARNMDFFPAGVVGPGTVVKRYAVDGRRPFTAVSWPGYAGVVSGMNDAGVVACVLLNHQGTSRADGTPITFRLREILETCGDLDAAIACFMASPVASEHYALLADAGGAVVLWREGDRVRRADPDAEGWLAIDNSPRAADGNPTGRRARHLLALARSEGATWTTDADVRAVSTATCQLGTNAQAMTFEPATGTIDLAVGTAWRAAAFRTWWRYRDGQQPADLGQAERLIHHAAGAWAGRGTGPVDAPAPTVAGP
jgi:hypothetical protein